MQDQVVETIRISLENAGKFTSLVKDLSNYTTEEDIAGAIRDVERGARAVIGSTADYADFVRLLNNTKADLLEKMDDGQITDLNKAYLKVVKAAENLNEMGLDKAIENAVDKKAMYNAFRLARTETARAYNAMSLRNAIDDPDCVAIRYELGANENNCDECSGLAEADNGAGPGVYDLDDCPETPSHANCLCKLVPVYKLPEGVDAEDIDATDEDFDRMDPVPEDVAEE
jgi:hypothetical protein